MSSWDIIGWLILGAVGVPVMVLCANRVMQNFLHMARYVRDIRKPLKPGDVWVGKRNRYTILEEHEDGRISLRWSGGLAMSASTSGWPEELRREGMLWRERTGQDVQA